MGSDGQQELAVLLKRVAEGDRGAFAELYRRTSAKLFASIRRILGNQAAAEDAVQDAYLKIWNRATDFDGTLGSPVAWMTTIARHAAIDAARRGAERVSSSSSEIDPELMESMADPVTAGAGAASSPFLMACLERLDADRQRMVLMAYCQGWSREELAGQFDRPVATVKTILRRSLLALKECLSGRE